nr:MAG TPA: hypothetical protein [Caudoviricetes sp.]
MLTKEFKFTDFNGTERTEKHLFHLSKAEIMEMEMGTTGGLTEYIQNIIDAQDGPSIIKLFKDLILKSYGVKSPDGREFIKNDQVRNSFAQTEAYSMLFMELATDSEAAAAFVNGIIPSDLAEKVKEAENANLTPAQIAARSAIEKSK